MKKILFSFIALFLCSSCAHVIMETYGQGDTRQGLVRFNTDHWYNRKVAKADRMTEKFCAPLEVGHIRVKHWVHYDGSMGFTTARGVSIEQANYENWITVRFRCVSPEWEANLKEKDET